MAPEKPAFEFVGDVGFEVTHTEHAILIGQHVANQFVAKARLNPSRFVSQQAEEQALIDKSNFVTDARHYFSGVYVMATGGRELTAAWEELERELFQPH